MQITENVLPEAIPELNALLSRVSLPSYKASKSQSEETLAYSSKLALDGKVIGYASNDGHGGADCIVALTPHRAEWEQVVRDFAILTGTEDVEPDALLISCVVERLEEKKAVKRMFRLFPNVRTVAALDLPAVTEYRGFQNETDEEIRAVARALSADAALRLYRREDR